MATGERDAIEGDEDEALPVLRVRRDQALQADLDEARRKTGLLTEAAVVRLALRQLAGRAA